MGTEVLRPQDCLIRPNSALFPCRKPNTRPFRKTDREGSPKPAKTAGGASKKKGGAVEGNPAVAGGYGGWHLAVFGTGRLGLDPDMIPNEVRLRTVADVYAGAEFAISPSPRALPLPRLWRRTSSTAAIVVDDSATRDLRRLLRLE